MASKPREKSRLNDKEQSERFKETARKLGVDESGSEFRRVFEKVVRGRKTAKKKLGAQR